MILGKHNTKRNVFEFHKSRLKRLGESKNVLQYIVAAVSASEVRPEWSYHVELQIESIDKYYVMSSHTIFLIKRINSISFMFIV